MAARLTDATPTTRTEGARITILARGGFHLAEAIAEFRKCLRGGGFVAAGEGARTQTAAREETEPTRVTGTEGTVARIRWPETRQADRARSPARRRRGGHMSTHRSGDTASTARCESDHTTARRRGRSSGDTSDTAESGERLVAVARRASLVRESRWQPWSWSPRTLLRACAVPLPGDLVPIGVASGSVHDLHEKVTPELHVGSISRATGLQPPLPHARSCQTGCAETPK